MAFRRNQREPRSLTARQAPDGRPRQRLARDGGTMLSIGQSHRCLRLTTFHGVQSSGATGVRPPYARSGTRWKFRRVSQPSRRLPPSRTSVRPSGQDRKSVVSGKSVSVRVDLGGRRIVTKKTNTIIDSKWNNITTYTTLDNVISQTV